VLLEPIRALSPDDMERIHQAALTILEDVGMRIESQKAISYLHRAGCDVDQSTYLVKFPKKLVQSCIDKMKLDSRYRVCRFGECLPMARESDQSDIYPPRYPRYYSPNRRRVTGNLPTRGQLIPLRKCLPARKKFGARHGLLRTVVLSCGALPHASGTK